MPNSKHTNRKPDKGRAARRRALVERSRGGDRVPVFRSVRPRPDVALAIGRLKQLSSVVGLNSLGDEKSPLKLMLGSMKSAFSSSTGPYPFELSGYSRLATTAGSVLQLTDYAANPRIPMCISTGGVDYSSDFTYLTSLFDQIVVYAISVHYEPANPYNRGVSAISYPSYVAYDNDALITPTTSVAGMRAQSERGSYFKMFCVDHTAYWRFERPGWKGRPGDTNYPWADMNAIGTSTETSVLGSVFFGGDGTLTASTTYGAVRHVFHIYLQNRF